MLIKLVWNWEFYCVEISLTHEGVFQNTDIDSCLYLVPYHHPPGNATLGEHIVDYCTIFVQAKKIYK